MLKTATKPTHWFDYDLQVWYDEYNVIKDCGHPDSMKADGCCNQHKYAGWDLTEAHIMEAE